MKKLIFIIFISYCICAKLPSTFKKCNRNEKDFDNCLTTAIKNAMEQLSVAKNEIGLPSFNPLFIPYLNIYAGTGPVELNQTYINLKVFGNTKIDTIDAKLKDNILKIDVVFPEIIGRFDYEVDGKILVFPLKGKGAGVITMDKTRFVLKCILEEYEKKNQKYYRVVNKTLSIEPQKMHFQLSNLFGGDKEFTNRILKAMNENWEDIYADVRPSYEEAFGQIFTSIFNSLLSKVQISNLFDD